jgi:putative ATP-binding cassette transporter
MRFLRVLFGRRSRSRDGLVLAIVLSAVGTAAITVIVNSVADRPINSEIDFAKLAMFVLATALSVGGQSQTLDMSSALAERLLQSLRLRIAERVRHADLATIERVGIARIYTTLARDTAVLSEASALVMHGAITGIAMVLTGLYVAWLSPFAFAVVAVLFAATVYFYRVSQRNSRAALLAAGDAETDYLGRFRHLLDGFKEVKMHQRRADDLQQVHLAMQSALTQDLKRAASRRINYGLSISHLSFSLLLATVVFALPQHLESRETAVKVTYVVIFLLSTLNVVMRALPMLIKANLALDSLDRLEADLAAGGHGPELLAASPGPGFDLIELNQVVHSYRDGEGRSQFTVGPCSLTIRPGEVVVLVGANGSGKSTILRLLTWLYEPHSGVVLWNRRLVDHANVADYRTLFSAVFSEFHLFDRLYGLAEVGEDRVNALLADLGLADRVKFAAGQFSTLELSSGQRKRLALAVALLEDRPILLLDEFTADQDPAFRERFYTRILPDLRAAGKTVVLVSHDPNPYGVADQVLTMRDGRIVDPQTAPEPPSHGSE